MRRTPSRFGRAVVLAAVVCALGVVGGCGRETFNLLPEATLDSAGQKPTAVSDAGRTSGGSSGTAGKAAGGAAGKLEVGGAAGKLEVGGFGGRVATVPGAGAGNFPCLGDGGCPDEEPCTLSDPFCTNCRPYTNDCSFTDAKICDPDLRRCVECRKDGQCNQDERCNTKTWRCAKACGGNKDNCGGDDQHLSCSPELGLCIACTKFGDCTNDGPFNSHCYLNACVECFENTQCQSQYCYKGHCIPEH